MGNCKGRPTPEIVGFTESNTPVCEPVHIRNLRRDIESFLGNELSLKGTRHMLSNTINTYRVGASVLVSRVSAVSGVPMPQEPPPGYDSEGDLDLFIKYVSDVSFYLTKFLSH